jgi:hypothetical protein
MRIFMMAGYPAETDYWRSLPKMADWRKHEQQLVAEHIADPKKADVPYERPTYPIAIGLGKRGGRVAEIDLVGKLLALDPAARISAADAMQHAFFDTVRNAVEHALPAPPIPSPVLVGCGDVLFAMERPPVGDYLATHFTLEEQQAEAKRLLEQKADWLYRTNTNFNHASSIAVLAMDIFHQFTAKKPALVFASEMNLITYLTTCYVIASKLDNDAPSTHSFSAEQWEKWRIVTSAADIVAYERDILTTLDMDLDRPCAATFLAYFAPPTQTESEKQVVADSLWHDYIVHYDIHTRFRGSQMAYKVLHNARHVTPCMQTTRATIAKLFDRDSLPQH